MPQCVKVPFFVQKLQILETLILVSKLTIFKIEIFEFSCLKSLKQLLFLGFIWAILGQTRDFLS